LHGRLINQGPVVVDVAVDVQKPETKNRISILMNVRIIMNRMYLIS
jgi:hypothetical protein